MGRHGGGILQCCIGEKKHAMNKSQMGQQIQYLDGALKDLENENERFVSLLQRIDEHVFNCPYDTSCCADCAKLRIETQAAWGVPTVIDGVGFT